MPAIARRLNLCQPPKETISYSLYRPSSEAVARGRLTGFVRYPTTFTRQQQADATWYFLRSHVASAGGWGARLASDTAQRRVGGVLKRLSTTLRQAFGVRHDRVGGHFAVVKRPPDANEFQAMSLGNGSILLHQTILHCFDRLARTVAESHGADDLLDRIGELYVTGELETMTQGRDTTKLRGDDAHTRTIADSMLALVVGHEMIHSQRHPAGAQVPNARIEREADAGGIDVAMRAGFSPLAVLWHLVNVPFDDYQQNMSRNSFGGDGAHLGAVARYREQYDRLQKIAASTRADGTPYLSSEQLAILPSLPTPARVKRWATHDLPAAKTRWWDERDLKSQQAP